LSRNRGFGFSNVKAWLEETLIRAQALHDNAIGKHKMKLKGNVLVFEA